MSEDEYSDQYQTFLAWRGIETGVGFGAHTSKVCTKCGGAGVHSYSSTALWHHGIGGQAITQSVCNRCWGSGDEGNPWIDWDDYGRLKKMEKSIKDSKEEADGQ